jgi:hypothetical protein
MKFFTTTLTSGTFTVSAAQGASLLSVQPQDLSSCTILGGIPFNGLQPSAITISNSNALTLSSASPNSPLDGITITWLGGTVDIIIGY